MSSILRRLELRARRKIMDDENPRYLPPRDGATRKKTGQPFRSVKFMGSHPEDVTTPGFHYTKGFRRSSPAPMSTNMFAPHHLMTVRQSGSKKATRRGVRPSTR